MNAPCFVTDPPALREARREAAEARLAFQKAKAAKVRSEHLRRKWVLATARVAALEGRIGGVVS